MTEEITIELNMCPSTVGTPTISTVPSGDTEVGGETITIYLEPEGSNIGDASKLVNVPMLPEGISPYCDLAQEDDLISWYRYSEDPDDEDEDGNEELGSYVVWKCANPTHCHWHRSFLRVYGANIGISRTGVGELDICWGIAPPCDEGIVPDDLDDDFLGTREDWTYFNMQSNLVVPGEKVTLVWEFYNGDRYWQIEVASAWYCTCCFTGGEVTGVTGEYGSDEIYYTLSVQGEEVYARASDHTQYTIGDWVFVYKDSGNCRACGRTTDCQDGCSELSNNATYKTINYEDLELEADEEYFTAGSTVSGAVSGAEGVVVQSKGTFTHLEQCTRNFTPGETVQEVGTARNVTVTTCEPRYVYLIVPIKIGSYGHIGFYDEYARTFLSTELRALMDACVVPATIIDIDSDNNQASIEYDGYLGSESAVDFCYRCYGQPDFTNGHAAFRPDDTVYVLRSSPPKILGHSSNDLPTCTPVMVLSFLVEKDWWLRDGRVNNENTVNWERGCYELAPDGYPEGTYVEPDDWTELLKPFDAYIETEETEWSTRFERVYIGINAQGATSVLTEEQISERFYLTEPYSINLWRSWYGFRQTDGSNDYNQYNKDFTLCIADGYDGVAPIAQHVEEFADGHKLSISKGYTGISLWTDLDSTDVAHQPAMMSAIQCADFTPLCWFEQHWELPEWYMDIAFISYNETEETWERSFDKITVGFSLYEDESGYLAQTGTYSCSGSYDDPYAYISNYNSLSLLFEGATVILAMETVWCEGSGTPTSGYQAQTVYVSGSAVTYYDGEYTEQDFSCYYALAGRTGLFAPEDDTELKARALQDFQDDLGPGVVFVSGSADLVKRYITQDYTSSDVGVGNYYSANEDETGASASECQPYWGVPYGASWWNTNNLAVISGETAITVTTDPYLAIQGYVGYGSVFFSSRFPFGEFVDVSTAEVMEGEYNVTCKIGMPFPPTSPTVNLSPWWYPNLSIQTLPYDITINVKDGIIQSSTLSYNYTDFCSGEIYAAVMDIGSNGAADVDVMPVKYTQDDIECTVKLYGGNDAYNEGVGSGPGVSYSEDYQDPACTHKVIDLYSIQVLLDSEDLGVDVEEIKTLLEATVPNGLPYAPTMLMKK